MTTKLGLHAQAWKPQSELYVKQVQPALVVTMDLGQASRIKQLSPNTFVIGRCWECGDGSDVPALIARMRQGGLDAAIGPNEPDRDSPALYEQEKHRMDKFHEAGFKAVVCNFATGTCPIPGEWPDGFSKKFLQQVVDQGHLLGIHAYGSPMEHAEEWLALRYRTMVAELRRRGWPVPQIAITECGIDYIQAASAGPGVWGGKTNGWRTKCDIQEYIRQLLWFEAEIQKDSYVKGAAIFQIGTSDMDKWQNFELGDDTQALINALPKVSKPVAGNVFPGYAFDRGGEKVMWGVAHESVGGGGDDNWSISQWNNYFTTNAQSNSPGSYHYLILSNGTILAVVPETMASASVGFGVVPGWNSFNVAAGRPDRNLNKGSINVCLATPVNMPAGFQYPAVQIASLDKLCREIQGRYPGLKWFTHAEVDQAATDQGMPAGQGHHDPRPPFDANAWRARLQGPVVSVPVTPPVVALNWKKIAWWLEQCQRLMEGEGWVNESNEIGRLYLSDAVKKRDAK